MKDNEKVKIIKYICNNILDDEFLFQGNIVARMILQTILGVCNG